MTAKQPCVDCPRIMTMLHLTVSVLSIPPHYLGHPINKLQNGIVLLIFKI